MNFKTNVFTQFCLLCMHNDDSVKAMHLFREKLPTHKVKSEFLEAIAANQVLTDFSIFHCHLFSFMPWLQKQFLVFSHFSPSCCQCLYVHVCFILTFCWLYPPSHKLVTISVSGCPMKIATFDLVYSLWNGLVVSLQTKYCRC